MTRDEAERRLAEYEAAVAGRDELVRAARAVGVSKHRIHLLSGIGRMTIDRILKRPA